MRVRLAKDNSGRITWGLGQLTIVEHALCPLSISTGSSNKLVHESRFQFVDRDRRRQTATATIAAPFGLLPNDELFLWGLLGLTFAQAEPSTELFATPHFILRRLGCIDAASDRGGSAYRAFRESLKRLAAVRYHCDYFYDPIRREHRTTTFGFLSYSLPVDPNSSRAWRIVWDSLFFEYCGGKGGCLPFDLEAYRTLDAASRRLYLFLSKIFWRREWTHWLDVRTLAVDVLGFADTIAVRNLKQKIKRAVLRLGELGLVHVDRQISTKELFVDRDDGSCLIRLRRGRQFRQRTSRLYRTELSALPVYDPLRSIGLDDAAIARVASQFSHPLIQRWADITLAARERFGNGFFKKSPQAFFMNNLKEANSGNRTPPDWWWACKKEEEQRITSPLAKKLAEQSISFQQSSKLSFLEYVRNEGKAVLEAHIQPLVEEFRRGGMSEREAVQRATTLCLPMLQRQFRQRKSA